MPPIYAPTCSICSLCHARRIPSAHAKLGIIYDCALLFLPLMHSGTASSSCPARTWEPCCHLWLCCAQSILPACSVAVHASHLLHPYSIPLATEAAALVLSAAPAVIVTAALECKLQGLQRGRHWQFGSVCLSWTGGLGQPCSPGFQACQPWLAGSSSSLR